MALVNSREGGAIETRSPDFRHFDRALLQIALPAESGGAAADNRGGAERGRLVWADPGQPFLELGQLGLGDGERPAFLVPAEGGWRFATTPRASPPRVSAETLGELARRGDPRLPAAILAALEAGDPAELGRKLGEQVRRLEEGGEGGAASRLFLALEKVAPRRAELEAARADLQRYFEARAAIGVHAGIARDLQRLFAESPPDFWATAARCRPAGAGRGRRPGGGARAGRKDRPLPAAGRAPPDHLAARPRLLAAALPGRLHLRRALPRRAPDRRPAGR